jgi:hypothetical protein
MRACRRNGPDAPFLTHIKWQTAEFSSHQGIKNGGVFGPASYLITYFFFFAAFFAVFFAAFFTAFLATFFVPTVFYSFFILIFEAPFIRGAFFIFCALNAPDS